MVRQKRYITFYTLHKNIYFHLYISMDLCVLEAGGNV